MQNAFNLCGENSFIFEIIENVTGESILFDVEQYWLDKYLLDDKLELYNLTPTAGSMRKYKFSKDACEKRSITRMGESNPYYGKKHSEEVLQKMRGSREGENKVKLTEEKVIIILKLIEEGVSNKEISNRFDIKQNTVSSIRHGKRWSFVYDKLYPQTI